MKAEASALPENLSRLSPYVRLVHDFRDAPQLTLGPGYILDHALHYFKSGSGDYTLGGIRYPILPNRLFLVRPGERFSLLTSPGAACHMLNIHFDPVECPKRREIQWPYPDNPEAGHALLDSSLSPLAQYPAVLDLDASGNYEKAFGRLLGYSGYIHRGIVLRQKAAMTDILGLLLLETSDLRQYALTPYSSSAIQAAINHLRTHLSDPLSLEQLAAGAGISPSHLSDVFRRYTGTSPMRHFRKMRIEHAQILLCNTDQPIKQIAGAVGFHSVHHFSRAFHVITGLPPAAYRSKHNSPEE